jgi:hypothetical protein
MNAEAETFFDRRRQAVNALCAGAGITEANVTGLRREVFADGEVTRSEADALFAAERAPGEKCAAWTPFFVEAMTDHVVWQARPTGIVNAAQGEWLLEQADSTCTLNALAALINVLAEAHRVPLWFVAAVRARAARGWPGAEIALAAASAEMALAA